MIDRQTGASDFAVIRGTPLVVHSLRIDEVQTIRCFDRWCRIALWSNMPAGLKNLKDLGVGPHVDLRHEQPALGVVLVVVALTGIALAVTRE